MGSIRIHPIQGGLRCGIAGDDHRSQGRVADPSPGVLDARNLWAKGTLITKLRQSILRNSNKYYRCIRINAAMSPIIY